MSDVASPRVAEPGAFRLRTVAILIAVGVIGFLGSLVLGAYAPGLRSGHNGGAHALSNAAVGYSGIVQLARATGRNPTIVRDDRAFDGENLLVITPEDGFVNVAKALDRGGRPTLVVLPKWSTEPDADHAGWADYDGIQPAWVAEGVLAPVRLLKIGHHRSGGRPLVTSPDLPAAIRFAAPRPLQVIRGQSFPKPGRRADASATARLEPLISDDAGNTVLGKFADQPLYVLADPDLLSNQGIKREPQAAAALAMLDWLNSNQATGIDFDVTLNGLGRGRSPLRLAFEPPGLAMTLAVLATLLLAGWHATGRFGAPAPRERALAFGKAALVDNAAALVRRAGRQARLGGRYADVVRERARIAFGVPARAQGAAVDAALDHMPGRRSLTELATAAARADTEQGLLAAAQALDQWRRGTM